MRKIFNTIQVKSDIEIEYIAKRSKFIANIKSVQSEEEALEIIKTIKKKYWDATHNTYAYCITGEVPIYKCSDDGEPHGTAGVPILEVIKGKKLENVMIIVTRYFGGTLLGTGGLVQAYTESAKLVLKNVRIKKKELYIRTKLNVDYEFLKEIQNLCRMKKYLLREIEYLDTIALTTILVQYDEYQNLLQQLSKILKYKVEDNIKIGQEWV